MVYLVKSPVTPCEMVGCRTGDKRPEALACIEKRMF